MCLLIRCPAIDVPLLRAFACAGMCLPSRCLSMVYTRHNIHKRLIIIQIVERLSDFMEFKAHYLAHIKSLIWYYRGPVESVPPHLHVKSIEVLLWYHIILLTLFSCQIVWAYVVLASTVRFICPCPSHPWVNYPDNIQLKVQVIEFLTQNFSVLCYFNS
jgi:hypothetical protein